MPQTAERKAEYRKENKEKIKEYSRKYGQSERGKKTKMFAQWRGYGIIGDYEKIYERRMNTNKCDCCNNEFKSPKDKHTDHNHKITDRDNFRNILCFKCNTLRRFIDDDYQLVLKMMTF